MGCDVVWLARGHAWKPDGPTAQPGEELSSLGDVHWTTSQARQPTAAPRHAQRQPVGILAQRMRWAGIVRMQAQRGTVTACAAQRLQGPTSPSRQTNQDLASYDSISSCIYYHHNTSHLAQQADHARGWVRLRLLVACSHHASPLNDPQPVRPAALAAQVLTCARSRRAPMFRMSPHDVGGPRAHCATGPTSLGPGFASRRHITKEPSPAGTSLGRNSADSSSRSSGSASEKMCTCEPQGSGSNA
jgi:hypothetical protein